MPIRGNRYDAVTDNGASESKKRMHYNEEDFEFGINFTVKYIGTQDVAQPHNRVEIVAAMRRIRFECKARGIKKQKIDLNVSVKGVRVVLFRRNKKKFQTENLPIIEHPIYRIFYVSHDSHDLLIFSYISREASMNQFRCNVFKAFKKSHAVEVVRTIGQAFDICHRMAIEADLNDVNKAINDDNTASHPTAEYADVCQDNGPALVPCLNSVEPVQTSLDSGHSTESEDVIQRAQKVLAAANFKPSSIPTTAFKAVGTITSPLAPLSLALTDDVTAGGETLSSQQQIQLLLQRQKELQSQQMHCLLSQMQLLKDQLAAETEARIDAQSRIHQLLGQNQELLEHINMLVQRLVQLEASLTVRTQPEIPELPKGSYFPAGTVASSTLHPVRSFGGFTLPRAIQSPNHPVAVSVQNVSPDSGHREISSDSLSMGESIATHVALKSWHVLPASQTLGRTSGFDVKQSLVTLTSAKSLEISQIANDVCARQCNPCSLGKLPAVPGDVHISEKDSVGDSAVAQLSPWSSFVNSTRPNSNIVSVLSGCNHNGQLSEIVTSSGHHTLPTCCNNPQGNVSNPIIMKDPTILDYITDDNSGKNINEIFLRKDRLVDVPVNLFSNNDNNRFSANFIAGNGVVSGSDVTNSTCHDSIWSAVPLHLKNLARDSNSSHITVGNYSFGSSNQPTNVNG